MLDEGVIKYQCRWDSGPPVPGEAVKRLSEWRDRLYQAGLIGVYPDGIGFGNISQRLGTRQFLISGTQTGGLQTTTADHYTLVDDWDIDQNTLHCVGPLKASSESLTHAALYEYSEEIQAIAHIHHPGLWATYQGHLPTTRPEVPYGTPAMADEMVRLFHDDDLSATQVLVMAGHADGLIAFDQTLQGAAQILLTLLASWEQQPICSEA